MKKTIVAAILGIAAVAQSFGQGSIIVDNYTQGTYNQVVWGPGVPGKAAGTGVLDPISFQVYYGEGTLSSLAQLTAGVTFSVNPGFTFEGAAGAGGWFSGATQLLPDWGAGDTYTFALVVTSPGYFLQGPVLWQETANIRPTNVAQTGFGNFPGAIVVVPEPSTFALVGLGAAALLIFRRKQ